MEFRKTDYLNIKKENVFLPMVPINTYKSLNFEPQYVTNKSISSAFITLDSNDCKQEPNKVDMLVSSIKALGDNASTIFTNITRINVLSIQMLYITPNVNPRNNQITFWSSNTNSFHTVFMNEENYIDPDKFMDDLMTALNTATGTSGITFQYNPKIDININPTFIIDTNGSGDFYFDASCSMAKKGKYLCNLQVDNIPDDEKTVGPVLLLYTRYVNFVSQALTKYAKIQNYTTGYIANILDTLNIPNLDASPLPFFIESKDSERSVITSFAYNPGDSVSIIDMRIYDEFGELFYIPDEPYGNLFYWEMKLRVEA